ncbi:DEKNAAC105542 [Brettanomyces naardenensis]|uniref:DEKNAAC105542 n=1 Tax=Brettanomyces naardenensis TaxID=13370 RepID=A0A448YU26_BRENA|nr:DEKNAAC105542 [Brettanomyces naardenensis]
MAPQFNFTTSERRASTSIAGSLSRSGLYIPQDFIRPSPQELDEALETFDADADADEDEAVFDDFQNPDTADISSLPPVSHSLSIASSLGPGMVKHPSRRESMRVLSDEAKLLQKNKVPIRRYSTVPAVPSHAYPSSQIPLGATGYGSIPSLGDEGEASAIAETWDEAVKTGKIQTSPAFELKSITLSSIPLVITFLLQSSLGVCSVFAVGHISAKALAGVTLGMMSSNMTAIAVIAGLASSLDTFLPQAYGAGKFHLVGLIFQRCAALILCVMTVVCTIWWLYAESILLKFLPDPESAHYAAQYLKVTSFGVPGYVLFETGKRFLQAQGIFDASTYVLFVCAPLNAIMNYTFVWNLGFGYIGAPMAVAINYSLMALGLFLYTVYTKNDVNPRKCWNGFHFKRVFRNWGELIRLSIPNLIMIVSEFLSFEILTFLASYLGTSALAAQSVISTMASLTYQVAYGVSISASTRIANFLGAQLPNAAIITARMVFVVTVFVALANSSFLYFGRFRIANWFSDDADVVSVIDHVFPLISLIQIFDALNATSAGCLRGQGMQKVGGYVNLFSYYLLGIPIGIFLAFHFPKDHPLGLLGLWCGVGLALSIIGSIQSYYVLHADYDKLVADALRRSNTE